MASKCIFVKKYQKIDWISNTKFLGFFFVKNFRSAALSATIYTRKIAFSLKITTNWIPKKNTRAVFSEKNFLSNLEPFFGGKKYFFWRKMFRSTRIGLIIGRNLCPQNEILYSKNALGCPLIIFSEKMFVPIKTKVVVVKISDSNLNKILDQAWLMTFWVTFCGLKMAFWRLLFLFDLKFFLEKNFGINF